MSLRLRDIVFLAGLSAPLAWAAATAPPFVATPSAQPVNRLLGPFSPVVDSNGNGMVDEGQDTPLPLAIDVNNNRVTIASPWADPACNPQVGNPLETLRFSGNNNGRYTMVERGPDKFGRTQMITITDPINVTTFTYNGTFGGTGVGTLSDSDNDGIFETFTGNGRKGIGAPVNFSVTLTRHDITNDGVDDYACVSLPLLPANVIAPADGCQDALETQMACVPIANNGRISTGLPQFFESPPVANASDGDDDMLTDAWETMFGLDPNDATGDNGKNGDPDGDGQTNLQELTDGTHPRGFFTRFFAEGATAGSLAFKTRLATANPGTTAAKVLYRFQKTDGTTASQFVNLGMMTRHTLDVGGIAGLADAEFSTICESDQMVVSDRTMEWDDTFYASHAETSIAAAAQTWNLAEGSTNGFNLFYLVQNPNTTAANIQVTFLRPGGLAPLVRNFTVPATSRFNIWVN